MPTSDVDRDLIQGGKGSLFQNVFYHLSPTLPPSLALELESLLCLYGGKRCRSPAYKELESSFPMENHSLEPEICTHVITDTLDIPDIDRSMLDLDPKESVSAASPRRSGTGERIARPKVVTVSIHYIYQLIPHANMTSLPGFSHPFLLR